MQEIRHDGSEEWTENVTDEQLMRALQDERNATVAVHRVGARAMRRVGRDRKLREYVVNGLGQWERADRVPGDPRTTKDDGL